MELARITLLSLAFVTAIAAVAADPEVSLSIRNNRFEPQEIRVPAGQKVRLVVKNLDGTPEEFESYELNREKVIAAGASATIYIGPLSPGRYPFFGDFHQNTARGAVVAE
jgi:plastocyanin